MALSQGSDQIKTMPETKEMSIADLQGLVLTQGEQIKTLTGLLTQGNIIKEAAKKEKPKLPEKPVTYKGKQYKALVPAFKLKGVTFTTEQANADEKLLAEVLAIKGQNIYKELV